MKVQFKCDVLANVREIGSAAHALDESAGATDTAFVVVQSGQPGDQSFEKSREVTAGAFIIGTDVHDDAKHRHIGMKVVIAQGPNFAHRHAVRFHTFLRVVLSR
jgi:hypothetical protein